MYTYLFFFLFKNNKLNFFHNREKVPFITKYTNNRLIPKYTNKSLKLFFYKSPVAFINHLESLFYTNSNLIFIDYNYNYNYLPLNNKIIFNRSSKELYKTINYFDIKSIVFFNINGKNFILKKLLKLNLINISISKKTETKKTDFCLNLPQIELYNYITYLLIISIYLKCKNKNISDPISFFI